MAAIQVTQLDKHYGDTHALRGVDFEVGEGELFGLIGPDGAGKTTLLRILVTLLVPDAGDAFVDGLHVVRDYRALRPRLGYMPGRFSLYTDLSVEENLRFFATIFGTTIEANYDQIRDIYAQIEPFRKRRAGALSGGMKQKLALSCALIHKPRVLVLDEPTTGVDAVSREEFWDLLARRREEGLTIIVSTPYMDEAARCDRVALIQDGQLLRINTPDAIEESYDRPLFAIRTADRLRAVRALESHSSARSVYLFGDTIHFTDERVQASAEELRLFLEQRGIASAVTPIRASIEDVFMAQMQTSHGAHAGANT